jgi:hypothetical protein
MIFPNLVNWFVKQRSGYTALDVGEEFDIVSQWQQRMWIHESPIGLSCEIFSCPNGEMPEEIVFPADLASLTIHDSTMSDFPDSILESGNLKTLRIIRSNISKLPNNIDRLSKLTVLCVRSGRLTELPDTICSLAQLHELDLYANKIGNLPPNFKKLLNLVHLDVAGNPIDDISVVDEMPLTDEWTRQQAIFYRCGM